MPSISSKIISEMTKPSRYTKNDIEGFFRSGQWDRLTMSHIWDRNAAQSPHKEAIADPFKTLTWAEAKKFIDKAAAGLIDLGLDRDQLVVLQLPNSVELHLLRIACEKAGVICLPVLSNMREHEILYILEYTGAAAIVVPAEFRGFDYGSMMKGIRHQLPKLKHTIVIGKTTDVTMTSFDDMMAKASRKNLPDDYFEKRRYRAEEVSIVFLTSGSTGMPKFVEYPAVACAKLGEHFTKLMKVNDQDVICAIAPASRGPNLLVYNAAARAGAKIVMYPWSNGQEALDLVERMRVTIGCLVPTQLAKMLEANDVHRHDLHSVRIWNNAGSVLPPPLVEAVEKRMGGINTNQYGAVDFGVMTITVPEDDFDVRLYTIGKPCFDTNVKIVDEVGKEVAKGGVGEIIGRGPCCSSGYFKDPKATADAWNDGWYKTGDLGRFDERGNVVIAGRKKDMIIRGGQNITPSEIEGLLVAHPKIREVAIVAMPDAIMGEKACAYIVPRNNERITLEEVTEFLKQQNVASYKLPERLEFLDKLPTVSEGQKIDKKTLTQDIAKKTELERGVRG